MGTTKTRHKPLALLWIATCLHLVLVSGCATPESARARRVQFPGAPATQITVAQLQSDLERFGGRFLARLNDGFEPLTKSENPVIRRTALRRHILYASSIVDIITAPNVEANLLDTVTFVMLCQDVLDHYWIPQVWGSQASALSRAFRESLADITGITAKVLTPRQQNVLFRIIHAWREANPNQVTVEGVRMEAFSVAPGLAASARQEAQGLLANVGSATTAVEEGTLFGERALFYAQRAPFLWRLQARVGMEEGLEAAALNLKALSNLPSLASLDSTLRLSRATAQEANVALMATSGLFEQLSGNPRISELASHIISAMASITHDWRVIVTSPKQPDSAQHLTQAASELERQGNRLIWKLIGAGAALILFAAMVFVSARLLHEYLAGLFFRRSRGIFRSQSDRRRNRAA